MRGSSRPRTASVALSKSCRRTLSGRSSRKPAFSAKASSVSAALSNAAKPLADLHKRSRFNPVDQLNQDQVEDAYLLFAQPIRFGQEQIRKLLEHTQPSIR